MSDRENYIEWLAGQNWLQKGDCVYVVSDMLAPAKAERERGRRLDMDGLVDALKDMVGPEGTLLFPTFNWDYCRGIPFDYRNTPARTGSLPNAVLKRGDFLRTRHPIYSFAVWGKDAGYLYGNDAPDSFGKGTIFEYMYEQDAKGLALGLHALKGMTYVHHVEQMVQVPYRYNKAFRGDYIDGDGVRESRCYYMYVRDLDINPLELDGFYPLEKEMLRQGTILAAEYGGAPNEIMRIRDVDAAVRRDILENDSRNMYRFAGREGGSAVE